MLGIALDPVGDNIYYLSDFEINVVNTDGSGRTIFIYVPDLKLCGLAYDVDNR